ncbi:hypothetical protein HZC31_01065 [Candidatus Woesearchaeota archaeon]|nr:hypothetical protein [Candidatus Woesearchaeota archaeon]
MTVGISLTNGKEAIVIADSRVSAAGRQSDSANKLDTFSCNNYAGVLFGAGYGNLVLGVLKSLSSFKGGSLDQFIEVVVRDHQQRVRNADCSYLEYVKGEIQKKAEVIADEEQKRRFIYEEQHKAMENYARNKQVADTIFTVVAYDQQADKVRLFSINEASAMQNFQDHSEIGSGADGAHMYLSTKLQGVDTTQLPLQDLIFFALNAYNQATVNQGVGGTPKIAVVSKQGIKVLEYERTVALANLSGACLSGFPEGVTSDTVRKSLAAIATGENPQYPEIAAIVGIEPTVLSGLYVPYSSWQERANRQLFPHKAEQ